MVTGNRPGSKTKTIRLGLVGAGWMAEMCCAGLPELPEIDIVAVQCRTRSRATAFAASHGIASATDSLDELLARPDVDAVYIATTNESHAELALAALDAGKAVLLEKPFTLTHAEAVRVVDAARRSGVLLMEAMWSRFVPGMRMLQEVVRNGTLGQVRTVRMKQGTVLTPEKNARVYDLEKGGGALVDIGVYPISILEMVAARPPELIGNRMTRHVSGVDVRNDLIFRYEDGMSAEIVVTCEEELSARLELIGDRGALYCDDYTFVKEFNVETERGVRRYDFATDTYRYVFQMRHFAECLIAGKRESDVLPLDRTLLVMRMLDLCREAAGYRFPQEKRKNEKNETVSDGISQE